MSRRTGVLAVGPGYCWQAYTVDGVECAAVYLERRGDGLRGLLRRDCRGWYTVDFGGERVDVPDSAVDAIKGTAPYGIPLLEQQAELAYDPAHRRKVRGYSAKVECPDCKATVIVA